MKEKKTESDAHRNLLSSYLQEPFTSVPVSSSSERKIYQTLFPLLPSSTPLATLATPFSTPSVKPCKPSPTALVPVVLLIVWPTPRPAVPTTPPTVREMPPTAVPSWGGNVSS